MADTFNSKVNYTEGWSSVIYNGTIDLSGNLTDSHYTQAFLIAEANKTDAGFYAKASGGGGTNGDVDVRLEVSNDGKNWIDVGTLVDLDADATARDGDALAGGTGTEAFNSYRWARIHADGLTGNDETTVDWSMNCEKNVQAASSTTSAGNVKDT